MFASLSQLEKVRKQPRALSVSLSLSHGIFEFFLVQGKVEKLGALFKKIFPKGITKVKKRLLCILRIDFSLHKLWKMKTNIWQKGI